MREVRLGHRSCSQVALTSRRCGQHHPEPQVITLDPASGGAEPGDCERPLPERARLMRGVWLRLRTESRARWKAWVAMGLLLDVIGGAVLTAAAGARRTDTAYPRMLQSAGAPDLLVAPNNTGLDGYYSALSRLPEVRSLSVVLLYGIGLPASGGTVDTNGPDAGSTQFSGVYGDKVEVLQGRLFDPNDARVAMVDEQLAELDLLRPGSTLHLLGLPNDQSGNPDVSRAFPLSFRVSGIAAFDDQIVPANRANGYPRVLLTPAFFRLPAYKR